MNLEVENLSNIIENSFSLIALSFVDPKIQAAWKEIEEPYRIHSTFTEEDVEKSSYSAFISVGEEYSYIPEPQTVIECLDRLVNLEARKFNEVLKLNFVQKYGYNAKIAFEEYQTIEQFIKFADKQNIKDAYEKDNGYLLTSNSVLHEYLRLKHGYYKLNSCDFTWNKISSRVYAGCFLYPKFLIEIAMEDPEIKINGLTDVIENQQEFLSNSHERGIQKKNIKQNEMDLKLISAIKHPIFKEEAINDIFNILKDYFPEDQHYSLKQLLIGEKIDYKLLFIGQANKIAYFTGQLFKQKIALFPTAKSAKDWLINNFKYLDASQIEKPITSWIYEVIRDKPGKAPKDPLPNPFIKN